jgi:hypothetical protein
MSKECATLMSTTKNLLPRAGLFLLIGTVISFLMLSLGIAGIEIAWTLQMPRFWIGDALGFGVHGALYLAGALFNGVLYGALCFLVFWTFRSLTTHRNE